VSDTPIKVRRHLSDDLRYRLLKLLSEQPQASQRQLSQVLGVSVGSLNYCVNALIARGWVKATNFRNSHHKLAYAYLLTPSGIEAKTRIAVRFLQRKMEEHEALEQEIAQLRAEVAAVQAHAGEAISRRQEPQHAASLAQCEPLNVRQR
jgi:EPS-associated MarR family transcriptional regulator